MKAKIAAGAFAIALVVVGGSASAGPGDRPDTLPPAPVTGLAAEGVGALNRIQLTWEPVDDAGIDLYRVYGSTEPDFAVDDDTLVGVSALPRLRHEGLRTHQTWYYKVTATDTWGNESALSGPVTATTGDTLRFEGEDLAVLRANTAVSTPYALRGYADTWSDNGTVLVRAKTVDHFADLALDLPIAGTYRVHTSYTQSNAYGIQTLAVDGHVLGEPVDGYIPSDIENTGDVSLGELPMTKGPHVVTLAAAGKNPLSKDLNIGVDYVDLQRIGRAPHDRQAPGEVTGAAATSVSGTTDLRLTWQPATDDVLVTGYEVYGSTDPNFDADKNTLLATVPGTRFDHTDLGLRETWYYRVRAVDGSGKQGPLTAVFSGVSSNTLNLEGENLTQIATTASFAIQNNCCGQSFSGGKQLRFIALKAGDTAELEFTIALDGTYTIATSSLYAKDYGIVQFAVDGVPVGSPVDLYGATYKVDSTVHGQVALSAGPHRLTMTIVDKNPSSPGYQASLDVLLLTLN